MSNLSSTRDAYVLRVNPSGRDRVPEALEEGDIIIGWSSSEGLIEETDWKQFRQILHDTHYAGEDSFRKAGAAAGNMWRFIHDMDEGDLVVVPHGAEFYVAEVTGPARYESVKASEDTAYRRSVEWRNGAEPIPRKHARAALQSRMKARQTCVNATDLVDDIEDVLVAVRTPETASLEHDLRQQLVEVTVKELRSGRINPRAFERLVAGILRSLGGEDAEVVARRVDKGADVVATYTVAETFDLRLAAQAKHWKPDPPVGPGPVEQLADGMDAEDADLGWVVTTGCFDEEAEARRDELEEERGFRIELIDGEQLAALVVEGGLRERLALG